MRGVKWTVEEDEMVIAGLLEFGSQWKLIKAKYPELAIRHESPMAIRDRIRTWGPLLRDQYLSGEASPRIPSLIRPPRNDHQGAGVSDTNPPLAGGPMDVTATTTTPPKTTGLSFQCQCSQVHNAITMMLQGLACKCNRDLFQMLEQVAAAFPWVVYILLAPDSTSLTDEVLYVGISEEINRRVKYHSQEAVKSGTFATVRVSVILGEKQLIDMLRPTLNINQAGGHRLSERCRIRLRPPGPPNPPRIAGFTDVPIDNDNGSLRYSHEFTDCRIPTPSILHESPVGLIFTHWPPKRIFNERFCFLKDCDDCKCHVPCVMRKTLNGLRRYAGHEVDFWNGLGRHEVKETFRQYKEIIRYEGKGNPNAEWTEAYTTEVLHRNEGLKKPTLATYQSALKMMWRRGFMDLFDKPWQLAARVQQNGTRNTQSTTITVLRSLLSHMTNGELRHLFGFRGVELRQDYHHLAATFQELIARDAQKFSKREKENWATLAEIRNGIKAMEAASTTIMDRQRVLWYKMMLEQATVRNDYSTLKVFRFDPNKDNYVDMVNRRIILNDYKTSEAYGRSEMDIEPSIFAELGALYHLRCARGEEYLFARNDGQAFTSCGFSNFVVKGMRPHVSNKRIGSQMLRKIVVSESRAGEASLAEKKEMSKRMLHSVGQAEKYRRID